MKEDDPPAAKAKITIGSGPRGMSGLIWSLYQPQMQRLLKTLEMTSAYNQFKEDVVSVQQHKQFEEMEILDYITDYKNWRSMSKLPESN